MIENDNQYVVTRRKRDAFRLALDGFAPQAGVHPLIAEKQKESLEGMIQELDDQMKAYESQLRPGDMLLTQGKPFVIDTVVGGRVVAHEEGVLGHFQAIATSDASAVAMRQRYLHGLPDRELTNN